MRKENLVFIVLARIGAGIAILLLLWAMERAFVNMNRHINELSSVAAIDRLQVVICSVIIGILLEGDKIYLPIPRVLGGGGGISASGIISHPHQRLVRLIERTLSGSNVGAD
ncbi:hypothetical protein ACE3MS_13885 [Paenibacillus dendritiformis]|uniref:hypothetical protein n=1 Tax=Paenibacillus dendritiformis TaxID=130049 RepID=UPI0036605F6C